MRASWAQVFGGWEIGKARYTIGTGNEGRPQSGAAEAFPLSSGWLARAGGLEVKWEGAAK